MPSGGSPSPQRCACCQRAASVLPACCQRAASVLPACSLGSCTPALHLYTRAVSRCRRRPPLHPPRG
eukprot:821693-Prymnesium_polylepis.1